MINRYIKSLLIKKDKLNTIIKLKTNRKVAGNALLSYRTRAFLKRTDDPISYLRHSTGWEVSKIADLLLAFGYNVDVIDYLNTIFTPQKDYSILIDVLSNLERLMGRLPDECIKIFHPCWSHWAFHNKAIYDRYWELKERREIVLKPTKLVAPNFSAELSDFITQRGYGFSAETYRHAHKDTLPIRHSSLYQYDWGLEKDYEACRKNFIWLGGFGAISKGLDLVLDVFSELPDYHLYVCGPLSKEPAFESAFQNQLYETRNIHALGFIDVGSEQFKILAQKCIALIYPSSTELSSGGVITCMHAGIIPIISKESGIDEGGFGYILNTCSILEIKEQIESIAAAPLSDLKERSQCVFEYARENYTKLAFENDYRDALEKLLNMNSINR